jgi:beta-glucosidase
MGFDGLVVSDWNGHGQVPGCDDASCAAAVNAGIDVFMVPQKWRQFIDNTVAQVEKGTIPMSRIDDAVTRILRVKMRAGLFDAPKPSQRAGAGKADGLLDKELARQAVRESLVLLKNNGRVLPLARDKKVLVVGRSADNLPNQTGGWSITWQGSENSNADFPNATSVLAGIKQALGDDKVVYDLSGRGIDLSQFGAVIAVIGESAYAEGKGDVPTLANPFESDLSLLKRVSGKGVPVVTVLMSGRPLYVTPEINRSDAFIAAWLPGTEGQGIADLLFRKTDGSVAHDFTGRLSYSWPKSACQTPVNAGDGNVPLFAYGYGLSVKDAKDLAPIDEVVAPTSCD